MLKELKIPTHARTELLRIDAEVQKVITESGIKEGTCLLGSCEIQAAEGCGCASGASPTGWGLTFLAMALLFWRKPS